METVIIIVLLIFGVIQIILFFKLWKMANNVKRIFNKLQGKPYSDLAWTIRKSLVEGDKQKVEKLLYDQFFIELQKKNLEGRLSEKVFSEIKSEYKDYFREVGLEMPNNLQNIKSAKEIVGRFTFQD